jgi:hypothetical protein
MHIRYQIGDSKFRLREVVLTWTNFKDQEMGNMVVNNKFKYFVKNNWEGVLVCNC